MVKFVKVDPKEVGDAVWTHRGRVSYPILKGFLETNHFMAMIDRTGMQQSLQSLNSSLRAYIISHKMAIKLFSRKGELYLMRLDVDEDGNQIEDWNKKVYAEGAKPLNASEVATRFEEEKDQTTK
jgi:hypothetical protein